MQEDVELIRISQTDPATAWDGHDAIAFGMDTVIVRSSAVRGGNLVVAALRAAGIILRWVASKEER